MVWRDSPTALSMDICISGAFWSAGISSLDSEPFCLGLTPWTGFSSYFCSSFSSGLSNFLSSLLASKYRPIYSLLSSSSVFASYLSFSFSALALSSFSSFLFLLISSGSSSIIPTSSTFSIILVSSTSAFYSSSFSFSSRRSYSMTGSTSLYSSG